MRMDTESILIDDGKFTCLCGNTAISVGFYHCDSKGAEVEPTIEGDWDSVSFVCRRCGWIIDQNTGEGLGRREETPPC